MRSRHGEQRQATRIDDSQCDTDEAAEPNVGTVAAIHAEVRAGSSCSGEETDHDLQQHGKSKRRLRIVRLVLPMPSAVLANTTRIMTNGMMLRYVAIFAT